MPARIHAPADDRSKDWLSQQMNSLQKRLREMAMPVFAAIDQASLVLSYLNPFTYISIVFGFIYRLFVSPHTHRSILGSIILAFILVLSLLSSVIAYLTFYRAYVPHVGFHLPVWLQYGETRVPYAKVDFSDHGPEISVDQAYDVSLHLTVPTNDRNMRMGNFMVQLTLSTAPPHNTTLHHSSRHASLVYEPTFARVLHAFKYLRTLFFFSSPYSVQNLKVPLLEQRIIYPSSLGKHAKIGHAKIQVGRQDVYNHPNLIVDQNGWGELQIYKATLMFDAHLDGLRWALYYHPYICFCFFSAFFFIAELMAVLCTWGIVLYRTPSTKGHAASGESVKEEPASDTTAPDSTFDGSPRGGEAWVSGATEIDSSSASSNDHRSQVGFENDLAIPSVKSEPIDDAVLVPSGNPPRTSIFSSVINRRSTSTSK